MIDPVWLIILVLAFGTFAIRFSFLGLIGKRALSPGILRHLRYAAVGVIPALIAPLVMWPAATGGNPDPARMFAAFTALLVGLFLRSTFWAVVGGIAALYIGLAAF